MVLHAWILALCATILDAGAPYEPNKRHPGGKYDYCNPLKPPLCAGKHNISFCLEDPEYPLYEVQTAIKEDQYLDQKYSDIPDQSANDLVDGISQAAERNFAYEFYTGASTGPSRYDETHWIGPEGYICPSEVTYATPRRARNAAGEWRVIVNDVEYYGRTYTQTVRMEACLFPGSACRLLAPCYGSKCLQQSIYHRLLSFDPCYPEKGLFIDLFKLPSGCSCQLPKF